MNKKEKFESFLESLKGNGQDKLIERIEKGFQTCFESILGQSKFEDVYSNWNEWIINMVLDFKVREGRRDEPLDGDEVEELIDIIRKKINLHQGNVTEDEVDF